MPVGRLSESRIWIFRRFGGICCDQIVVFQGNAFSCTVLFACAIQSIAITELTVGFHSQVARSFSNCVCVGNANSSYQPDTVQYRVAVRNMQDYQLES